MAAGSNSKPSKFARRRLKDLEEREREKLLGLLSPEAGEVGEAGEVVLKVMLVLDPVNQSVSCLPRLACL